jgi:hypothetical protein
MPPVDEFEGAIMGRLKPVFEPDFGPRGIGLDQIQHRVCHAIGARSDGQTDHAGNGKSGVV